MSEKIITEKKLRDEEAVEKFKQLVNDVNICMFTTINDNLELFSRPMVTTEVDDEGNAWFFTNEFSEKIHEISKDNNVYLIYSNPKNNTYVIKELGSAALKAWFPEGADEPKLCLLKVSTDEAYYWNHSASKMSVFFSMLKAIAKKEKIDSGEIGKLNLSH